MPTYDYLCEACEHRFEEFQSITAEPLKKCPECGRNKLRRLIGPGAALMFKGSGFYITDYRSASYKKAAAAEGGSGSNGSAAGSNGSSGSNGSNGSSKGGSQAKAKSSES